MSVKPLIAVIVSPVGNPGPIIGWPSCSPLVLDTLVIDLDPFVVEALKVATDGGVAEV